MASAGLTVRSVRPVVAVRADIVETARSVVAVAGSWQEDSVLIRANDYHPLILYIPQPLALFPEFLEGFRLREQISELLLRLVIGVISFGVLRRPESSGRKAEVYIGKFFFFQT